ncbi:MAG: hypothetical protein DKINENOH_05632 [bacterium]|nr:hypothetical protein [bacterium]
MTGASEPITLTTLIAIYGAILSTFILGWNIFRDLTDRGKLKVHCYIGKIVIPAGPKDESDYLVFNVTNTGRRPIVVTHVGGSSKTNDFIVLPRNLPRMLQPGEYLTEYSVELQCLNEDLKYLCAGDSLGNVYRVKKKVTKELIKKAKKKMTSGN